MNKGLLSRIRQFAFKSTEELDFSNMVQDPWPPRFKSSLEKFLLLYRKSEGEEALYFSSFEWLREFKNLATRNEIRKIIEDWIETNHFLFSNASKEWPLDVTGYRVWNWISMFDFYGVSARDEFKNKLKRSLSEQFAFLKKNLHTISDAVVKFRALKGMFGYLFITGQEFMPFIKELEKLLGLIFLEDGGHVSRNARLHLLFLRDLIDIRTIFASRKGIEIHTLNKKIRQLASVVRLLRHSNGVVASFEGNYATKNDFNLRSENFNNASLVDACLSLANVGSDFLMSAEMTGYMRFAYPSNVCIVSTRLSQANKSASLGVFNFEWSFKQDIIFQDVKSFITTNKNYFYSIAHDPKAQRSSSKECDFLALEIEASDIIYKREMDIANGCIKAQDKIQIQESGRFVLQFMLGANVEVVQCDKVVTFHAGDKLQLFRLQVLSASKLFYNEADHSIIVSCSVEAQKELNIKWGVAVL
ncbi:MAG: hypothetical protein H6850_04190 [Alphaproteobacteria bacterium]|nr:MAG: hypothetical protein H6850_04190 [Alphaproteobacteria bacterium]